MSEMKTHGIYIGKLAGKDGAQKKDNTKLWRMWKLTFKPSQDSDKQFSMSTFQSGKETLNGPNWETEPAADMEVGKMYTITYKESGMSQSGNPFKNFVSAEEGKLDIPKYEPKTTQTPIAITVNKWEEFKQSYNKQMEGNPEKSNNHMLGTYMVSVHADKCMELVEKCKANFGKSLTQ